MVLIETVTVAETSYQILRILSFCNWERAQNPLININVLTFLVKKGTVKLSWMYIFREYYAKKKKTLSQISSLNLKISLYLKKCHVKIKCCP